MSRRTDTEFDVRRFRLDGELETEFLIELSRLERRAVEAVKQRQAAMQHGEAFR